jgi:hypothetical protein
MKKAKFLSSILVCLIAISLIVFSKALCDDEDSTVDMLCDTNVSFRYEELFASILSRAGIFYEHHHSKISSASIMAFLERHEKSPPLNPVIFAAL